MWALMLRVFVVTGLLLLASCAGNETKPMEKEGALKPPPVINKAVQKQFEQAVALLKENKHDEAIILLKKITLKEKRFPAPFVNLGMAFARTGKDKLAEEHFMQAIKLDARNSKANNELGLLYRKMGRFADAKKAYETALNKDPKYLPARKNLGILCDLYLRNLQCAMEHFEKYQELSPDDKQIKIWIADLKRRIK